VPLLQVSLEEAATGSAALQFRGDLRVIDDECHANIQLIDNSDGHLLWGRIFRQTLGDDAAAGLLQQVAPRLEPQLIRAIDREAHDGASVDARTLLIKATGVLSLKGWSRRSFEESAALLRGALAQNANMALAHAQLALILALGARFGLLAGELAEADVLAHADQALQLDDLDSNIAGSVGCALADIGKLRRARPLLKRAIDLNPNNAQAWAAMGALHLLERDFDTAVQALEKGLSISPMDPRRAVWRGFLAVVRLFNGDVDRAISEAQRAIEEDHRNHMPHLALAAAHLSAGDPARARTSLGDAREIRPELSRRELDLFIGEALAEKLLALDVGHSPSHSPWAGRGT
ncbi:MAG: tetratricopeptide repeat protein, partial [Pseudomonadota bacterium]